VESKIEKICKYLTGQSLQTANFSKPSDNPTSASPAHEGTTGTCHPIDGHLRGFLTPYDKVIKRQFWGGQKTTFHQPATLAPANLTPQ
jgi:hypothetical protein